MSTSSSSIISIELKIIFFIFLTISCILFIYWPGLNGPFMFDDFPNFETLQHLDQSDVGTRIKQYIFSGSSGPSGRPVSLLSFMINDNAWPSQPSSFLYTNMMIHVLNCLLIFLVLFKLCQILELSDHKSGWIAAITTAFWAIHPLQVSTVLYIVQRMTILSTLFTLAAITGYLSGRMKLNKTPVKAYWQMSLSIMCFGLLAFLSKETGALLLIYILIVEYCLLRTNGSIPPPHFRYWEIIFLWTPNILMFGYFLSTLPDINSSYTNREFTLVERLLTESRIIFEYLYHILIPKIGNSGLFHDDYIISRTLFEPPITIVAMLAIIGLILTAIKLRKNGKVFSFAIFWFLGGHLMESTIISLELYFEHRNYLPMLGPLFGLVYTVSHSTGRIRFVLISLLTILILSAAFFTSHNTKLWGQPWYSSAIWAEEHPSSIRAQQFASASAAIIGDHKRAREYLVNALERNPNEAGLILQIIEMDCKNNILTPQEFHEALVKLTNATYSNASLETIKNITELPTEESCTILTNKVKHDIILTLINNPNFNKSTYLHALYYWLGLLYAEVGDLDSAIESLDIANSNVSVIDIPLQQALWLYSAGLHNDALRYVQKARAIDERIKNPFLKNTRKRDIENLEKIIQNAISIKQSH